MRQIEGEGKRVVVEVVAFSIVVAREGLGRYTKYSVLYRNVLLIVGVKFVNRVGNRSGCLKEGSKGGVACNCKKYVESIDREGPRSHVLGVMEQRGESGGQ